MVRGGEFLKNHPFGRVTWIYDGVISAFGVAGFCYMNSALCKIFIVGQIYICLAMLVLVSLLPGGVWERVRTASFLMKSSFWADSWPAPGWNLFLNFSFLTWTLGHILDFKCIRCLRIDLLGPDAYRVFQVGAVGHVPGPNFGRKPAKSQED